MPPSNRERVGRAFELLAEGLGPFVEREMTERSGAREAWFEGEGKRAPGPVSKEDPKFLLDVMRGAWNDVFRETLGRAERNVVHELLDTRNAWAHNNPFSLDDADRALGGVERILRAVSAGDQAAEVARSRAEVLRLRLDDQRTPRQRTATLAVAEGGGLTSWRDVVTPHPDVASGRYQQAEFAADLAQVHRGEGSDEYTDPVQFFARTYLTEGLQELLSRALQRVSGAGGVPLVDLQTNFGGGKTHSLLALYHLLSGTPLSEFPEEVQRLVREKELEDLPSVKRAVIVGTDISPGEIHVKPDGTQVHTLWGEIAWQLGGPEAYRLVQQADETRTSPGEGLTQVFKLVGPCLVLVDEWVAYVRQLYNRDDLPSGGSFDTHFTFAQTLTEAAKAAPGALVVVSIPASSEKSDDEGSALEVGGVGGREALRRLRQVIGRTEFSWRPASAEEGFEIVRRRLFEPVPPDKMVERDRTATALAEMYVKNRADYPADATEPGYRQRIISSYPIHPELFDRLYTDWSTLERFQRTRGVLRLMAAVVHALWEGGDRSAVILPASLPLDDQRIANELTRYLDDSQAWAPVIEADIDGVNSWPVRIDRDNAAQYGRYSATRRAARAVFLASAPTLSSANRGVEVSRVKLACVLPGERATRFESALGRLAERATYLHAETGRYWFGINPNVNRRAQEEAERLLASRRDELQAEIIRRIQMQSGRGEFRAVHPAPPTSADVPDDPVARLVILPPSSAHTPGSEESPALAAAREILDRRGSSQRIFRNMLIFLAADQRRLEDLERAVADHHAWREINERRDELNLDPSQARQAAERLKGADQTVGLRLNETYSVVIAPDQPDPNGPITWPKPSTANGDGTLAERASRKVVNDEALRTRYAPSVLRAMALDGPLGPLWSDGHVSVDELWQAFAQYVYLPRLQDRNVLEEAVEAGPGLLNWREDAFAIADGIDPATGRYLGLKFGELAGVVTGQTLIVHPDTAMHAQPPDVIQDGPGDSPAEHGDRDGRGEAPDSPGPPTKFYASVRIDPERPIKALNDAWNEVLHHIAVAPGATIEITLEARATTPEGFAEKTIRDVTENAAQLKFDSHEFDS